MASPSGDHLEQQGSLLEVIFPELLASLHRRRFSGALLLRRGRVKKIAWFSSGQIFSVRSNLPDERLGRVMVREGLISESRFEQGLKQAQERGLLLGQGLVKLGCISAQNLEHALKAQARAKLLEVFEWTLGDYQLSMQPPPAEERSSWEISVPEVVWKGIRTRLDLGRLRLLNAGLENQYLHPGQHPGATPDELGLSREEREVLSATQKRLTVGETRDLSTLSEVETEQLLYGFRCLHLVELRWDQRTGEEALPPPLPIRSFRQKSRQLPELSASHPSSQGDDEEIRSRLSAKLEELSALNHFQVLGVPPSATTEEIKRAYFNLARHYHPEKFEGSEEAKRLTGEVYRLLTHAQEVLVSPGERGAYERSLHQTEPPRSSHDTLAAENHFHRGEQLARSGKFVAAVEALEEAVRLQPQEGPFRAWLGWSRFRANPDNPQALAQALASLEQAAHLSPHSEWSYLFTGLVHQALGRPDKALKSLKQAQACNPENPEVRRALKSLQQTFR